MIPIANEIALLNVLGEHRLQSARTPQAAGQHGDAARMLLGCEMMPPGDPRSSLFLAESLLASGDLSGASHAARKATRRAPGSPDAWRVLARVRGAQGYWAKAVDAVIEAARLALDDADIRVELAAARLEVGYADGAEVALRRALTLAPGHAMAIAGLASLMRARGNADAATAMLRQALTEAPASAPLRVALASGLLTDGEHAAGLALFDVDPPATAAETALHRAHEAMARLAQGEAAAARLLLDAAAAADGTRLAIGWARVMVQRAAEDPAQAAVPALALENCLNVATEPMDVRITARFALAGFWSQQDDRARAFRFWSEGHRLLRALQPFSRPSFQGFVDASIAQLGPARFMCGARAHNDDTSPVFVVGMPRSGTTLAEQILAGHAAIFGASERAALGETFNRLAGEESAQAVDRLAALDADSLDTAAASYLAELHALAPGASRVVDKMPGNFRLLGLVGLMLPGARIIHCVRDPRDVGFSIFSRRFLGYHPYAHDLADLGWYIAQHEALMRHWTAVLPNPVLRVHLHDWIRDLPGTLRRVLDFLDLPYDANCERFFELDREVRTASRAQVRRPVNRLGMGRWREYAAELQPMIESLQAGGALPGGGA